MTSHTEKTEDILAQLTAARTEIADLKHDIERHVAITSEQATEIVGKGTEIARLSEKLKESNAFVQRQNDYIGKCDQEYVDQSVLLKKAEATLNQVVIHGYLAAGNQWTRELNEQARAVLSELQLKGNRNGRTRGDSALALQKR